MYCRQVSSACWYSKCGPLSTFKVSCIVVGIVVCHPLSLEGFVFLFLCQCSVLLVLGPLQACPPIHSVEVMVYQYDKLFGILTITHIFIFLRYSEFPSWLPWQPIQILQYPKSI